jgi:hypothetical protein
LPGFFKSIVQQKRQIMLIFQKGTIIPRKCKGESGLMTGCGQRGKEKGPGRHGPLIIRTMNEARALMIGL